jgi:hypothetical protein
MRSERFETPGHVRLEIENQAGSVDVTTTGETVTDVEVMGEHEPSEIVDEALIDCRPSGDGYVVRVKLPKQRRLFRSGEAVRIVVAVPHGVDLSVSTASASVDATGRPGKVDVETASGNVTVDEGTDVRLRSASGDLSLGSADSVDARSVSGEVVVGRVAQRARVSATSGGLRLGEAWSRAAVETVSGSIEVDVAYDGVTAKTVSGDVALRCVMNGDVALSAVSGDAVVGIPPGRAIEVDAQSLSGRLRSDIDLDGLPVGGVADPDAKVRLKSNSVSGNLHVVRASLPPGPPTPSAAAESAGAA